jgi:ribonucleoside-diphosphate reductase alpha chain
VFITATGIDPLAHVEMQAVVQAWVDGAISKTISLPAGYPRESLEPLFERAHSAGLNGCTIYRAGTARGQVVGATGGSLHRTGDDVERCCVVS